ncbi:MAG: aminopeptidase N, partial [Pseudolabrys sp.]|nr:aminopeptidase N [Pseudolabrys sp.]
KRAMAWDERAFGREYDLDVFMIVAVGDFNMGAMENKGLNIFNDKYVLATAETATDTDFAGVESVIAHEYFHNWTGNRITCRDWFQLCLKEGLTVFRDQEFSADQRSRAVERISDVRGLRNTQFIEDAGPLAHPVRPDRYKEINNFYTSTVYEKGAEVVRMIKTLLGPEKFRAGMDLYFQRHDGEAATVEQFVQCFADAGGLQMPQFMRWYSQAGTPQVTVTSHYDEKAKTLTLDCEQSVPPTPNQPTKEPMLMPIAVGLIGTDGSDLPLTLEGKTLQRGVLTLTGVKQQFVFTNVPAKPVVSANRNFSAPIKLATNLAPEDLSFLAAHDSDPFNRWQAIQALASRLLLDNVTAIEAGQPLRRDSQLLEALKTVLNDVTLEPAFKALALGMPSEADMARDIAKDVDPDAIFKARKALRADIGNTLAAPLATAYERMAVPGPYSPDATAAGHRSLRNACLDLLAAADSPEGIARAARQYDAADNMTDRFAALSTLSIHNTPERERVLADFYRRYSSDALIVDKWFALQAMIPDDKTLDRVRELEKHPAFAMNNPNRVRSLIGSFSQANPTQFHRADGKGYDFTADIILALDPKNPQVASRLATGFRTWRTMNAIRRTKAEAALRRIKEAPALSRDVADIVERALEAH